MSSSAYCRSVLYPLLCRVFTILSPSAIQRADDFVGMEMPIMPLSSARACRESDIRPSANVVKTILNDFMLFFGGQTAQGFFVNVHGMRAGQIFSARKSPLSYPLSPCDSRLQASHECERLFRKSMKLSRKLG